LTRTIVPIIINVTRTNIRAGKVKMIMKIASGQGWSYVFVLIFLIASIVTYILQTADSEDKNRFIKVEVEQGDTLWDLSKSYANNHRYTDWEFVQWVEKNNGLHYYELQPGQEIMIPVEKESSLIASQ
jgi:hypothetical protein